MRVLKVLALLVGLVSVSACTPSKYEELKSPCVGAEGSPCDRRPVNDGWQA